MAEAVQTGDEAATFCPWCSYDLRGAPGGDCPECGGKVDPATLAKASLPWEHRAEIGWQRALFSMIWLTTFHPQRLRIASAKPVDYAAARRFHAALVTWLILASAAIFGTASIAVIMATEPLSLPMVGWGAAGTAGLWVAVFAATGAASYWMHPRRTPVQRQNRAIALSYYAVGPLGWLPLPVALICVTLLVGGLLQPRGGAESLFVAIVIGAVGLALSIYLGYVRSMSVVAHHVAGRGGLGIGSLVLGMPLLLVFFGVLLLAGVPLGAFFIWIVVSTL